MPELDALRGIACLMVLFFHGFANRYVPIHLNWTERGLIKVSGYGWTGVNLFFVLSGFLITGILLETRERADYYRRFYIRRALRILPAYYGILFLVAITWQLGLSDRPVSWAFLGLSAIYLANLTPLFGVPIQFGVLWSLAVEEHFYLLWPAAVRRLKERGLVILAVALCLISLGSRIAAFHLGFNVFAYYTWMVCDGLAMGALVAIGIRYFLERRGAALSIAGTALGLALTAFALEKLVGRTLTGAALQITGFNSLYACALVVALLLGSRFGIRLRPLEWVGDISYGVYLVHTLVFDIFDAMARRHFPSLAPEHSTFPVATVRFLIVAAITLACAWLSRWYFEERFLRMKDRFAKDPTKIDGDVPLPEVGIAGVPAAACPRQPEKAKGREVKSRVLLWGLLLLCALYLVQARSPLRLTNDSIVLLSIASSAADGHGFLDHGAKTHYPPGYPFMVVCLDELGAARPWGLVTLNALFLFMGLAATWYIARVHFQLSDQWSLVTSLLTASSFVLIKHFTLPLTDVPFFGLSLLSIALAVRAEKQTGRSFLIFWSLALLVATAGAFVRPVSIALYPALLWLLAERLARRRVMELNQKALTICCAVAAIVGSAATAILMRTKYVQEALSGYSRGGLLHTLAQILLFRVHEFGELVLNAPASKLGRLSFLVWILGVSAAIAAFTLLRRIRPSLVEVYLVAYAFILFLWPYEDTRFWTPVLPVICGECVAVMRPWNFAGWKKALGVSYAAVYLLLGFAAMAYSTEITFSGCDFPRRFGDGRLRSTYQAFYSQPTDLSTVDRQALELLERYARPASR